MTIVDEYSSIDAAANIVKPEDESVIGPMVLSGKGCCSGKVAEEEGSITVSSASLKDFTGSATLPKLLSQRRLQ